MFMTCFQLSFSQVVDLKLEAALHKFADLYVKTEIMGINHLYKVDTVSCFGDTLCSVMQKDTIYTHQDSNIGPEKYQLKLDTYETLCEIVITHLSGIINSEAMPDKTNININFTADMSGVIKRISFIYDTFLNIPIPIWETIEEEIKSKCRIVIDKKSPALAHASYVTFSTAVFLKGSY